MVFRGSTFHESSKGVTKVSEEYSKDVLISYQECFKDILWAFEEFFKLSFKSFSRVLQLGTPRPQLVCIYEKRWVSLAYKMYMTRMRIKFDSRLKFTHRN